MKGMGLHKQEWMFDLHGKRIDYRLCSEREAAIKQFYSEDARKSTILFLQNQGSESIDKSV
jgi:hypothetical protein